MITLLSLAALCRCAGRMLRASCRSARWPALLFLLASPASAAVIYTGSSVVFSGTGSGGLSARATFTVDPGDANLLRVRLENTASGTTPAPSALLTSFYFNVLSGTTIGTSAPLTYAAASGQVYRTSKTGTDTAVSYVPPFTSSSAVTQPTPPQPSDLRAFLTNDDTWQFKNGLALVASQPPLAFGVGTVGNSGITPDNFNGNIVGGFNFGIYVGDIATQNLDDTLLVKDRIDFAFAGFAGYSLGQVSPHGVFGYGTKPDTIISVPEPAALPLVAGLLLVAGGAARRGWRRRA